MNSSEDIRKTIKLLESIQEDQNLDEGFLNPFDIKVGGVTIGSIIKEKTDAMTPEEKTKWFVEFLGGFFGVSELVKLGNHLLSKRDE